MCTPTKRYGVGFLRITASQGVVRIIVACGINSYYNRGAGVIKKIKLTNNDLKTLTTHYHDLTINNFSCELSGVSGQSSPYSTDCGSVGSKSYVSNLSYNSNTGILSNTNGNLSVSYGPTETSYANASYVVYLFINSSWLDIS